jgi:hypothetical protein
MSARAYGRGRMNRFTFVVQVHPDGVSTLENVSTEERVAIDDLEAVAPQIRGWLESLAGGMPASRASSRRPPAPTPPPRSPR